ncbi:6507_t:CDS:2 [Gigaspora margarita]|uniref:6507_t:CDS:1 n=1 Tax=Gigaspora margarita TaxID=4874 RepID=A0ABN7V2G4_GIGMA|nr:6507_t:CDS:2 [Gigaspora margarita]
MLIYTNPDYYFDNSWIIINEYYKEKFRTIAFEEILVDFIKNTDENILLSCKKYKNLLLKGIDIFGEYLYNLKFTKIDQYYNFINGLDKKNNWMKYISFKLTKKFISYLYKKETELNIELFEIIDRNNIEDNEKEISLIEIKYLNRKIILYKNDKELDFGLIKNTKKNIINNIDIDDENEDYDEYKSDNKMNTNLNNLQKFIKYNIEKKHLSFDNNNELVLYENKQEIRDKKNKFKNSIDMITNGEDFEGLLDTKFKEKLNQHRDHKDVEILKKIFSNMKKNNITINGDLNFKTIPNIDTIFKIAKKNSKKIR